MASVAGRGGVGSGVGGGEEEGTVALLRSALARVRLEEARAARAEVRARFMSLADPSSSLPVRHGFELYLGLLLCQESVLENDLDLVLIWIHHNCFPPGAQLKDYLLGHYEVWLIARVQLTSKLQIEPC